MEQFWHYIQTLTNSEEVISRGGLVLVFLVVYLETGWFFGFFLPGDYLLFLAGMLCDKYLGGNIWLVFGGIFVSAILGNFSGYVFGKLVGRNFENRKETWYFKRKYIERTREFFNKNGAKALIIGRFLPIIRTFAPLLAGMARMPLAYFAVYNIVGALLWSGLLVLGGYYLGHTFPAMVNYVEYVILFFLAATTLTLVKSYLKFKAKTKQTKHQEVVDNN